MRRICRGASVRTWGDCRTVVFDGWSLGLLIGWRQVRSLKLISPSPPPTTTQPRTAFRLSSSFSLCGPPIPMLASNMNARALQTRPLGVALPRVHSLRCSASSSSSRSSSTGSAPAVEPKEVSRSSDGLGRGIRKGGCFVCMCAGMCAEREGGRYWWWRLDVWGVFR